MCGTTLTIVMCLVCVQVLGGMVLSTAGVDLFKRRLYMKRYEHISDDAVTALRLMVFIIAAPVSVALLLYWIPVGSWRIGKVLVNGTRELYHFVRPAKVKADLPEARVVSKP